MAFELAIKTEQALNYQDIFFSDITGSGVDGYGAPNPEINDVIGAEITFSSDLYVGNVIFNFVILNGVIQDAEVTDYNGNITNIFADLSTTVFPFVDLEILAQWIIKQDEYPDALFDVMYRIVTSTDSYQTHSWFFTVLNTVLCYDEANTRFANGGMNRDKVLEIQSQYYAFASAIFADDKEGANKLLKQLLTTCKNCGCGCK